MIQYIDDFLSGGYTQFSIDQNFGTLDLSGSASDLSTDQSSTEQKQMEIMLKLSSNFIDCNDR